MVCSGNHWVVTSSHISPGLFFSLVLSLIFILVLSDVSNVMHLFSRSNQWSLQVSTVSNVDVRFSRRFFTSLFCFTECYWVGLCTDSCVITSVSAIVGYFMKQLVHTPQPLSSPLPLSRQTINLFYRFAVCFFYTPWFSDGLVCLPLFLRMWKEIGLTRLPYTSINTKYTYLYNIVYIPTAYCNVAQCNTLYDKQLI